MRTTEQFSITLPLERVKAVERKIKSRAYASVSEVMRDGVRALLDRDAALERWLREEVAAGHKESISLIAPREFQWMRSWRMAKRGGRLARLDKPLL